MTEPGWPALDRVLAGFGFVPSRTGSVISTIYGDAVLPRGGSLALADLLALMRRLGASEGVVRTAVSRLARDGVLAAHRRGRRGAYALTPAAEAEFRAAVPLIYGPHDRAWDGCLHLVFPEPAATRPDLPGFTTLVPGVLLGLRAPPPGTPALRAQGDPAVAAGLATRVWTVPGLDEGFRQFLGLAAGLADQVPPDPLSAMAARTIVIHAYRRLALKTPSLPAALRPPGWPGTSARALCLRLYQTLGPASEAWLDAASDGVGPIRSGPDPVARFRPAP